MQLRDRFIVADPHGLDPDLARAAQAARARTLIDATRPGERDKLDHLDPSRTLLRVGLDDPVDARVEAAVLAPWRIAPEHVDELQAAIAEWQAAGVPAAVEVRTKEEGRRAVDAGADALVARGVEGPGRVSERSNLVLLPALEELDVPLIAWGGAGPNATGALLVHAEAVVLGAPLYLLDEAGLDEAWTRALGAFDGSDVKQLGNTLGEPFHVHARVADQHVHDLWEAEQASEKGPTTRRDWLTEQVREGLSGFDTPPGEGFTPLGHDAAHASFFERFEDLEAALAHLESRVDEQLSGFALEKDNDMARAQGTEYPVIQGAMANVSEIPEFAKAVADEGGLPFLAFAALREGWAREALEGTLETLDDDQPFGCGIIGLDVNAEKRDAHIRLLEKHQPPYALIAAGTAEQALGLEEEGIDTFLHTPSRGIVRQALEMGLNRVVVEGNECGGHIGKLPSLVLWDQALQEVDAQDADDARVWLAGGIGDAHTSAMAGTLAGSTRAKVGALMGTAYLATEEIVDTGAIPSTYQDLVLAAHDTDVTGRTTGIRSRSAPTPFTQRVTELEQRLVQEGTPLDERRETVEKQSLGATRLAARRLKRGDDGTYHEVDTDTQFSEGQFLMGQGAELIDQRYTIADLHEAVTEDAADIVDHARERLAAPFQLPRPETEAGPGPAANAVAVVGLGCVMPDAPNVEAFWENLVEGHVSIQEMPEDRWPVDPDTHYDPDTDGHTYTLLGAFVTEDTFDPIEHRIPPTVADHMDPAQKWVVQATGEALEDAGLDEVEDRDRWAVILGNAQSSENRNWSDRRLAYREIRKTLEAADADPSAVEALEEVEAGLEEITEDTMPGELSNIIASRVCNVYDIGGPARTIDTACASSLAAAEEAVRQLRQGDVDVAITGGVDRSMHPSAFSKFSAIGALSDEGSFPFDERASGFVMGEGCGVLVLKRLSDAVEDGDRVYALVDGAGSSSDGAGKGITAPNPEGQKRAVQRAWDDAGADPSTAAFVEAHGTGTPVGDPAEAQTLTELFDGHVDDVALGSVKANVGHLKSAAGAAGLLKAVLSLHTGTYPPTPVEEPTSQVDWSNTPLDLALEARELPEGPIRAGVSAFGFGGTNSHVVLASPEAASPAPAEPVAQAAQQPAGLPIHVVGGDSREELAAALDADPETWTTGEDPSIRVAVHEDASREDAEKLLEGELPPGLALKKGIGVSLGEDGQLGLVFPGQGSQYPGMLLDLADEHPAAREVLEEADQVLTPLIGQPISDVLALEGEEGQEALTPTDICQPAVLACDVAILRVLEEHGVEPDVVAGHSLGEYAALVASGVLSFEDALHAVSARGQEMADVSEDTLDDPGGLVAVRTGPEVGRELIEGLDAWLANINSPEQTVLAGTSSALATIQERAEERDIQATELPVSAGFHSPIVELATEPLREVLERIPVDPPEIPVIANATAEPYPEDPEAIRDLLAEQVASPVRWMETMERFEALGVDLVVETGPKAALTGLARQNLPETTSVPTAHPRKGAPETLETALVALAAHGHLPVERPTPTPPTAGQRPAPRRPGQPTQAPQRTDGTRASQPREETRPNVVVSGVSVGAPAPDPHADVNPFDGEHVDALLAGENRIARVPDDQRRRMAEMGVTRLVKDDDHGPRMVDVDDPDEVIHLAGRLPGVDLGDYEADESWLEDADPTARYGVAAALEALTDASIPLVPDRRETSTGTTLTDGWVLPEPMQDETGVILASAFPGHASLAEIVESQQASAPERQPAPQKPGSTPAGGDGSLTEYLADLVPELDRAARKTALDLLVEHSDGETGGAPPREATPTNGHRRESDDAAAPSADGEADFPRDFLFRTLAMGHAQIAQLVDARGPNMQLNTACASTTTALATAQDWIEQGRCERVIVVGVDVAGNETLLPWIGSGFLAAGAATTSEDVEEAALPFDERRHGMLVGSGAVGLVVETEDAAAERGVTPLAELVDTHVANSAFHGSRLEPDHVTEQVGVLLDRARDTLDVSREELAGELTFVSHEPATPARGGSAEAEVRALREALGEAAQDVLVTNTKGLTGHAMGAGIEDVTAVEILRSRRAPPVANLEQVDPDFQDLTFSQGGETDRSLSLRFAAGFGSQVALALFRRAWETPGAVDEETFAGWLADASAETLTPVTRSRCLRAVPEEEIEADDGQPRRAQAAPTASAGTSSPPADAAEQAPDAGTPDAAPSATSSDEAPTTGEAAPEADGDGGAVDVETVRELLRELVSKKTGYPEDVIEPDMDLEADLGVDTVKQAEVLSQARNELDIPPIEGLSLSEVPTLEQASRTLAEHANGGSLPAPEEASAHDEAPTASGEDADEASEAAPAEPDTRDEAAGVDVDEVRELLRELVSKKTGYPEDVIEPDMDLEADLGVDTVKQAEVLSQARNELDIPPIEGLSLSEVPTLEQASQTLAEHAGASEAEEPDAETSQTSDADEEGAAVRVLSLAEGPAPAGARLPEGTRVRVEGPAPDELEAALEEAGARTVDADAEFLVLGLGALEARAGELLEVLERLQEVPEGTRVVLLADAEGASTGLDALAGTLTAEGWPARAVLVDGPVSPTRLAREILTDLETSVRVTPTRRRSRALAPTGEPAPVELPEGAVVLATGGLGAAVRPCLEALAEAHDVRLAVAGRSPIEDPGFDPDDEDAVAALRDQLLDEAREAEDPVRPAEVEERVQHQVKLARRARALERLEAVAETRYDRVDATDAAGLREWVETVSEAWDAPAMIVHGAGLDASRALTDKPREEMAAVLDVKLTPVRTLAEAAPEAHHVAFGSIAGVTGNPGQADYALANGTLNELLADVDGTVLHWTAWDAEGGMADDDTVRAVLEERGVAFLDPEEGAERFVDWAGTPGAFAVADRAPTTPRVDTREGAHLELAGDEAWLVDHAIGDRPLFAGVRHLQSIVEAAGDEAEGLSEVRFEKPLWVTQPVHARVHLDGERARIESEGTVRSSARLTPGEGAKRVAEPELEDAEHVDAEAIYERLFHGPSFQVLEGAEVGEDAVLARADLSVGGAAPWLMALEAGMQAAGLAGGSTALPVGVEAIERGQDPVEGSATVAARRVDEDLAGATWDVTVYGQEGVVLDARGVRLTDPSAVPSFTDAAIGLSDDETTVRVTDVGPHDPRDPRAKRNAEREAGTQAARRALEEAHGAEVDVTRDEDGRPHPEDAPGAVSITHSRGLAAAVAHPEAAAVGIDLERVEARGEAWREDTFTDAERARIRENDLADEEAATLFWTLKEAASKALGTGLDVPTEELEVVSDANPARVDTPEGAFEARWTVQHGAALSVATPVEPEQG